MNACGGQISQGIACGTPIVVGDGPLQGVRGTVLGLDGNDRLIVALMLLRGLIAVTIDPGLVEIDTATAPTALVVH